MLNRETLDRIVELGQPAMVEVGGREYSTRKLEPVRPPLATPLEFATLTGLLKYITHDPDSVLQSPRPAGDAVATIHVVGPTRVDLISHLDRHHFQRHTFARAEMDLPGFPFGQWLSQEAFVIGLQTGFAPNGVRDELIRIVGSITGDEIRTSEDDGVSQSVTAKAGVHLTNRVNLPNPVQLCPYRTFREVTQPESPFILRVRPGSRGGPEIALFEADGGAWRLEAVNNVAAYMRVGLELSGVQHGDGAEFQVLA